MDFAFAIAGVVLGFAAGVLVTLWWSAPNEMDRVT